MEVLILVYESVHWIQPVENWGEGQVFVNMYITVPLQQEICWLDEQDSASQGISCIIELENLEGNLWELGENQKECQPFNNDCPNTISITTQV
jgi:hypothetical protein